MTLNKAYRDTLGNPVLRSAMIGGLYMDREQAIKSGSEGWKKAIDNQLHTLSEGDYSEADHGEPPHGAEW